MATFIDSDLYDDATGTPLASQATPAALSWQVNDLVVLSWSHEGAPTTPVIDTGASTPTFDPARADLTHSNNDLQQGISYWVATNTTTTGSVRIRYDASGTVTRPYGHGRVFVIRLGAGNTGWALDGAGAGAQGNADPASTGAGSYTATGAAVAGAGLYGTRTWIAHTGFTMPAGFPSSSSANAVYALTTGSGSLTCAFDLDNSVEFVAQIAFFRETSGGGDTTAPVLTSPASSGITSSGATVGATTDEGNGTAYVVATLTSTAPTIAQIKAGQDAAGASVPAGRQRTLSITATGAFTFTPLSGLSPSTAYWYHIVQPDAAANNSNVVTGTFTTSAVATGTIPLSTRKMVKFVGGTASIAYESGISYRVQVYADGLTLGSALYTGSAVTTNSTGQLADITDAAFTAGTVYKVALTNQATSETTVTELTAT